MTDASLRLDRWLWHARFIKQRTLAQTLVGKRRVRLNDRLVSKVHQPVRVGDVITLVAPQGVQVLRVLDLGCRRGPAHEARTLYESLVNDSPAAPEEARPGL